MTESYGDGGKPRASLRKHFSRFALAAFGIGMIVYAFSDHPLYGGVPGFGKVQAILTGLGALMTIASVLPIAVVQNILLLVLTAVLALGIAEWVGNAALGPALRPAFREDPRLIFKLAPGRTGVFKHAQENGGGMISYKINSHGFRGPELLPAGATKRVVVYGDSFIHAFYTPEQETFTSRLKIELENSLNEKIEVINAGVGAYGPDQILYRLEQELEQLKPDVVVVSVFAGNDYGDLMRNKMFRLNEGGALIETEWKLDKNIAEQFSVSETESILIRALRSTLAKWRRAKEPADVHFSYTDKSGRLKLDSLIELAEREFRSHVVERDPLVTNINADYYSADVALRPNSASAVYKVRLMNGVLERIASKTRARGVPLLFLFIPHPGDLSEPNDWMTVDMDRFPEYTGRNQVAPLEAAAKRFDVPYISLYDAYRESVPADLYLKGGDDHWNARGQALGAKLTALKLVESGLLSAGR